jgi:hypothetical protein
MINWGGDGAYIPKCTCARTEAEKMTPAALARADALPPKDRGDKLTTAQLSRMKQVCYACPIRKGCAEHALKVKPEGLYAGVVLLPWTIRENVTRGDGSTYISGAKRSRDTALQRLKNLVDFLREKERIAS